MNLRTTVAALAAWLLMAGCAHVKPARMALPEALSATDAPFEELPLQGVGGKARGEFRLGAAGGRFERSASRLELFNASLNLDRASVRYSLGGQEAECRARRNELQRGVLALPVRPFTVSCEWSDGARLALDAEPLAAGGTQQARRGRYEAGSLVLDLRSEHRLQGTKWPLAQPAGYLLTKQGVVVAALDLTGVTPRLWRPRAASPEQEAATRAAIALALLWDPER